MEEKSSESEIDPEYLLERATSAGECMLGLIWGVRYEMPFAWITSEVPCVFARVVERRQEGRPFLPTECQGVSCLHPRFLHSLSANPVCHGKVVCVVRESKGVCTSISSSISASTSISIWPECKLSFRWIWLFLDETNVVYSMRCCASLWMSNGRSDGRNDGHILLKKCDGAS